LASSEIYRLKDMSTDVPRPGPACDCLCALGGSPSFDALARPFSLVRKGRMLLLPPRLGPYSPPHVDAYLQMSDGSRDDNSAAAISQPSLSILTRHMHPTTDDPRQVLKIAVPSTSTLVRSCPLSIEDLQVSSILWIASCLLTR